MVDVRSAEKTDVTETGCGARSSVFRCRQCEIRKESSRLRAIGWRIPRKSRGREDPAAYPDVEQDGAYPEKCGDERIRCSAAQPARDGVYPEKCGDERNPAMQRRRDRDGAYPDYAGMEGKRKPGRKSAPASVVCSRRRISGSWPPPRGRPQMRRESVAGESSRSCRSLDRAGCAW